MAPKKIVPLLQTINVDSRLSSLLGEINNELEENQLQINEDENTTTNTVTAIDKNNDNDNNNENNVNSNKNVNTDIAATPVTPKPGRKKATPATPKPNVRKRAAKTPATVATTTAATATATTTPTTTEDTDSPLHNVSNVTVNSTESLTVQEETTTIPSNNTIVTPPPSLQEEPILQSTPSIAINRDNSNNNSNTLIASPLSQIEVPLSSIITPPTIESPTTSSPNNNNNNDQIVSISPPIVFSLSPIITTGTTTTTTNTSPPIVTSGSTPSTPTLASRGKNAPTLSHRGRKRKKDDAAPDDESQDIHLEIQKRKERSDYFEKNPQILLESIRNVIFKFQQSSVFSFSTFKDIWRQEPCLMEFFEIQPHQPELIHILYYGVIGYTLMNQPVNSKSAIIYALYVLYNCQIVNPPVAIDITLNIWDELVLYFNCFKLYRLAEPYHIFKTLINKSAFHFSASLHPIGNLPIFKTNSTSSGAQIIPIELVGVNTLNGIIDIDELNGIHTMYNQIKKGTNPNIPKSLNITRTDFNNEVYNLLENNTIKRLENMLLNKIPGLP